MSLWTDFLGAELRFVSVDGIRTRVLSAGQGEPAIVLLHGRGGHLESWRANAMELATRHRVIAFDLLGHGLTEPHDGSYGISELARHAAATFDALELTDAVVVGQSIGGWIAARLALEHARLVRALALIEPAGLQTEDEQRADPGMAERMSRGGRAFAEPTSEAVRERFDMLVVDPRSVDDELVETRRRLYGPSEARRVHQLVRAADNQAVLLLPEVLARIDVEVLIIHGAASHTPLDAFERATAALPAGRLTTLEGARQWPQLERPEEVNRLVAELAGGVVRAK